MVWMAAIPLLALAACYKSDDADQDGFSAGDDCNDGDPTINPAAQDFCDGIDNNCSGDETDALDMTSWYQDGDSDTYGAPGTEFFACESPVGYVDNAYDYDDADELSLIHI